MKEFTYFKLASVIILIATTMFGIGFLTHLNGEPISGITYINYGQEGVIVPFNCSGNGLGNSSDCVVKVDDGALPDLSGICVDEVIYVPIPVSYTYESHILSVRYWFSQDWLLDVSPWATGISYSWDYYFNTTDLSDAVIGNLHVLVTPPEPIVDANVTLNVYDINGINIIYVAKGYSDSQGFCHFNLTGLSKGKYSAMSYYYGDNLVYGDCQTWWMNITVLDNGTDPTPTPNNDTNTTNDTNSTVDPNINDTNISIVDAAINDGFPDSVAAAGAGLGDTGIPLVFAALACIASIFIIKRK